MTKFGVAAATLVAILSAQSPARADPGAAIAAGIGGFALGAIAGGGMARPPRVYYEDPEPVYIERPRCWRERRPVFDEYGDVIGYRPRRVCD